MSLPARCSVGAVNFTVMPLNSAVSMLMKKAEQISLDGSSTGVSVHFANAFNVALAGKDESYANVLNSGTYVFSDGVPITWVGKRAYPQHEAVWERVYGPDVMGRIFSQSTTTGLRHYLLGSTPSVLAALDSRIKQLYPHAQIVGSESPPFHNATAHELEERDGRIRASGATMVWVGLGTPKQDWEVARLASVLPVVALAVGAAFDFLAGTTRQAPAWMQRNGLEWLYRFGTEPRRLGHRYLWGNTMFVLQAVQTIHRTPKPTSD